MDPEKKQAASHAFVQVDAGFPQQLVVCKIFSKFVPVPGTYAITVDEYSVQ